MKPDQRISKFDWYACTLDGPVDNFFPRVAEKWSGDWSDSPPQRGYARAVKFDLCTGERLCRVSWAGPNGKYGYHVESSGYLADEFANWLRSHRKFRVSRADVCIDFDYTGCWDDFYAFFVARANHYGLKLECQGDYVHGVNGRTLYIGSRTSAVRIRIYEKGIKQLSEGDLDASRDWVRVELQVRPKGKNKLLMWVFDSDAWLGSSKVMTEFVEVMHSWSPEKRPVGTVWKPRTSLQQRFDSMLRQYGPTLMEYIMIHHGGDFEALGRAVVERLEALESFRRESA